MYNQFVVTPIGWLEVVASDTGVQKIIFADFVSEFIPNKITKQCVSELKSYFKDPKFTFEIPLDIKGTGTSFQHKIWKLLMKIPVGKTKSYIDIAVKAHKGNAYRAVGSACNKNPVPILIPCHRVISKDGSLGGYVGGIDAKRWLLAHEEGSQ